MLVIPAYQLDVLTLYGQLWRSLSQKGGPKIAPFKGKNHKNVP